MTDETHYYGDGHDHGPDPDDDDPHIAEEVGELRNRLGREKSYPHPLLIGKLIEFRRDLLIEKADRLQGEAKMLRTIGWQWVLIGFLCLTDVLLIVLR